MGRGRRSRPLEPRGPTRLQPRWIPSFVRLDLFQTPYSASEWAVWIATAVLSLGAYARHGLPLATLYGLATSALCTIDPSLQSVQLLNLAAVVYDLSFELHRLYTLVSNRPLLMMLIMVIALGVEWLLERYEAEDLDDSTPRGMLAGCARLGRSVGRILLPAVMGVLIACAGWLIVSTAMLHPTLFTPLVEVVEQMLGARYACSSASDCIYVTGSSHQLRVHGVYVLSPRRCSGKPVYRQRGAEGLYLHSPADENQWNVGPDVCDNSPRNKWMELYSNATTAADIGRATWFEYTDESGWTKNADVVIEPCAPTSSGGVDAHRGCVQLRGSSRDDAVFLQTGYYDDARQGSGCAGNGKPVYLSQRVDDEEGVAAYLYSPARRNSWLVGADPCRANGWMEVRSSAEQAEYIQAGASGPWQEYNGSGWVRTQSIRALPPCASPSDDCVYISGSNHQQHTHGMYIRTSIHCDGKPVYMQQTGSTDIAGADCPHGHGQCISQARGSSGSPAGVKTRSGGSRTAGHAYDTSDGDYRRLYLFSPSGRESWMVGRDACKPSGWLEVHSTVDRVEGIDGIWREHVPGGAWASNAQIKIQLNALQDAFGGFTTRADGQLNDPDGVLWRLTSIASHLPPTVVPLDEDDPDDPNDADFSEEDLAALGRFEMDDDDAAPCAGDIRGDRAPGESSTCAPTTAECDANGDGARAITTQVDGGERTATEREPHSQETTGRAHVSAHASERRTAPPSPDTDPASPPPPLHSEAAASAPEACIDLVIEPSLEGGRLLAIEHAPSQARAQVHAALRASGWSRRWLRPEHYSSPHASSWLRRNFWHSSRLGSLDEDSGSSGNVKGARRNARSKIRNHASKTASVDASVLMANSSLALRGWLKASFSAEDVVRLQQACNQVSLRLASAHLLTADRQQTLPLALLQLWSTRARLAFEQKSHLVLLLCVLLFFGGPHMRRLVRNRIDASAAFSASSTQRPAGRRRDGKDAAKAAVPVSSGSAAPVKGKREKGTGGSTAVTSVPAASCEDAMASEDDSLSGEDSPAEGHAAYESGLRAAGGCESMQPSNTKTLNKGKGHTNPSTPKLGVLRKTAVPGSNVAINAIGESIDSSCVESLAAFTVPAASRLADEVKPNPAPAVKDSCSKAERGAALNGIVAAQADTLVADIKPALALAKGNLAKECTESERHDPSKSRGPSAKPHGAKKISDKPAAASTLAEKSESKGVESSGAAAIATSSRTDALGHAVVVKPSAHADEPSCMAIRSPTEDQGHDKRSFLKKSQLDSALPVVAASHGSGCTSCAPSRDTAISEPESNSRCSVGDSRHGCVSRTIRLAASRQAKERLEVSSERPSHERLSGDQTSGEWTVERARGERLSGDSMAAQRPSANKFPLGSAGEETPPEEQQFTQQQWSSDLFEDICSDSGAPAAALASAACSSSMISACGSVEHLAANARQVELPSAQGHSGGRPVAATSTACSMPGILPPVACGIEEPARCSSALTSSAANMTHSSSQGGSPSGPLTLPMQTTLSADAPPWHPNGSASFSSPSLPLQETNQFARLDPGSGGAMPLSSRTSRAEAAQSPQGMGGVALEASVAEQAALAVLDDFTDWFNMETASATSPLPDEIAMSSPGPLANGTASIVPEDLLCPISHTLMLDPVLAADGHAYERAHIEDWLSHHLTSPLTGEPLQSAALLPCHALRKMSHTYLLMQRG